MFRSELILAFAGLSAASISISDPSDYVDLSADTTDNSLKAIYDITATLNQIFTIEGPYYYDDTTAELDHVTLTNSGANDTSVVVATEGADLTLDYVTVEKYGYSTNLYQASFYGSNAAVNIANDSMAYISNSNITTHNGAANIFAFGTGTTVYVNETDLYSSGPCAHGLYAAGNATIVGQNIRHYSGGNRCSSFSGDTPAGYIYISDSVAHTNGIGSAIFYALGEIHATNVKGHAANAPILFSDADQVAEITDCDLTAGLLAGTVMFSSSTRESGALLSLTNSKITTLGDTMPGLWFGNVIAEANIVSSEINTTSGILVIANMSQVTQEFDFFAGYEENSSMEPAEVDITVAESTLTGDLVAYNGSTISWSLTNYSSWTGTAYSGYGSVDFAVSLDATSNWTLTSDVTLQNFTDEDTTLSNVISNGYTITYNASASASANGTLGRRSVQLPGGGILKPMSNGFRGLA